jgi:hypothetical protein
MQPGQVVSGMAENAGFARSIRPPHRPDGQSAWPPTPQRQVRAAAFTLLAPLLRQLRPTVQAQRLLDMVQLPRRDAAPGDRGLHSPCPALARICFS